MAASGKRSVRDVLSWVCVVSLSRTARLFTVLPCTFHLVWRGRLVRLVHCDCLWSVRPRCAVHLSGCALVRLVLLCWRGRGLSVQSCTCTVAILAQGTSWAVAVTQAFFVAPCVAVVLLRLFGLGLRFGVAVRPVRGSCRGCYDLGAAVGSVWGIVVCVVFRFRRVLRRSVLVSWLWLRLAAARKQAASREILLWMTPSEAPKALQASECSELLDPMRASCWISAQH